MKSFAIILILAVSSISFAATKCYKNSAAKAAGLPALLCIENIGFYNDSDKGWLQVKGKNTTGIYETEFTRDETIGRLVIQNEPGDYCQSARMVTIVLKITGRDYYSRNFDRLKISINTEISYDSCHSTPDVQEYSYKQVK
ncbi:MAG: hypothetical protein H7061_08685 [Bdellovibrionaceae bacterium]|nr:hypothetical protein [Bdellovibrio sp.]